VKCKRECASRLLVMLRNVNRYGLKRGKDRDAGEARLRPLQYSSIFRGVRVTRRAFTVASQRAGVANPSAQD
jgi:hypothetical protein